MAYSTLTPPSLTTLGTIASPGRRWFYSSADTAATVDTSGYISNARDLGMLVGDILDVQVTGTGVITAHRVVSIAAGSPGAADLGDGTVIGSATNTD